jgi:hypothetical protein
LPDGVDPGVPDRLLQGNSEKPSDSVILRSFGDEGPVFCRFPGKAGSSLRSE